MTIQKVAVVGLGAAGLSSIKELQAAGIEATGFDVREEIGGLWALNNNKNHNSTGIYEELTLNSTRTTSEFSDFPWNAKDYNMQELDEGGHFPHKREAGAYLQAYSKHFNLSPSFRLGTVVTSIHRKNEKTFLVKTKTLDGEETEHEFDAVIMCNGRFATPKLPPDDGLMSKFTGKVLHSQQVKSLKEDFQQKRVLIIGGAVSGTDISFNLSRLGQCQTVVNSVRRPQHYVYKFTHEGKSLELAFFNRLGVWLKPSLPESVVLAGFKSETFKHFPNQLTPDLVGNNQDLVPPKNIVEGGFGYGSGYVSAVKDGTLKVKPAIASADGKKITFKDGTSQEFDVVILATGYRGIDLSMLDDDLAKKIGFVGPSGMWDVAAYKRTLVPDVPNFAVTKCDCFGANFPLVEMQARYIAAIWSGKITRPKESKIRKGALAIKNLRMAGKHYTYDVTHDIMEELGDELGVTPTLGKALCNPSELLLGPLYPSYYRTNPVVDGHEVAEKAKERLEWCKANPAIFKAGAKS